MRCNENVKKGLSNKLRATVAAQDLQRVIDEVCLRETFALQPCGAIVLSGLLSVEKIWATVWQKLERVLDGLHRALANMSIAVISTASMRSLRKFELHLSTLMLMQGMLTIRSDGPSTCCSSTPQEVRQSSRNIAQGSVGRYGVTASH